MIGLRPVLALSGGVGGAKLALGLDRILVPGQLTVVANTGDDFEYLGLHISPDIDSVLYALAGVNNPATGWGRDVETWTFMSELENLGIDSWFRLGDRDLAVHVYRTLGLHSGVTLTTVTEDLRARFRISSNVVPMSDDSLRTIVETDAGNLSFQEYFVRRRCEPAILRILVDGSASSRPSPGFIAALEDPQLAGIVLCPSNPFLSIDPILAIPGVIDAITNSNAPVVAISPIVDGKAIKGPTAKIMTEMGLPISALSVARHYESLLDGFIIDTLDEALAEEIARLGIAVETTDTIMKSVDDRTALARKTVELLVRLQRTGSQ